MKTIWKFPIKVGENVVEMPVGAEVLSVQAQHGEPQMWALVRPGNDTEKRYFSVFGTGHNVAVRVTKYIDTFQLHGGHFVGHVFEVSEP